MYPIKLYLKQKPVFILHGLALLFFLLSVFWVFFRIGTQDEVLFLHYNILFGVDLLGPWYQILNIPLTGLVIIFVNSLLGWILYDKGPFPAVLLAVFGLFFNVLLFVSILLLEFLNV